MNKVDEFVKLIDIAIAKAETLSSNVAGTDKGWMAAQATTAKVQFERLKQEALTGRLAPSEGAGLGISRALGEWAPDDLFDAGVAVENFYRQRL